MTGIRPWVPCFHPTSVADCSVPEICRPCGTRQSTCWRTSPPGSTSSRLMGKKGTARSKALQKVVCNNWQTVGTIGTSVFDHLLLLGLLALKSGKPLRGVVPSRNLKKDQRRWWRHGIPARRNPRPPLTTKRLHNFCIVSFSKSKWFVRGQEYLFFITNQGGVWDFRALASRNK